MAESLKLVNLNPTSQTSKHPLQHDHLPNPASCFRLIIFSPSNSGKSNLIKNLVTRPEFGYSSFFRSNIFLFSQTIHLDAIWQDLALPSTHLYDHWNDDIVQNLMHYSKKQPHGILIVLDDMITSSEAVNNKKSSLLKQLFYQGRHHKISLVLVSQKMKDIPVGMRTNATHLVCFNLRSKQEEEGFFRENDYIDDLEAKYRAATAEPYNFLYVNKVTGKAYHNFEVELPSS